MMKESKRRKLDDRNLIKPSTINYRTMNFILTQLTKKKSMNNEAEDKSQKDAEKRHNLFYSISFEKRRETSLIVDVTLDIFSI